MFGRNKGFVSRVKKKNQNVIFTIYFLHCKALVSKTLPADLVFLRTRGKTRLILRSQVFEFQIVLDQKDLIGVSKCV